MRLSTAIAVTLAQQKLTKAEDDIPEVQAAIVVLLLLAQRHWRQIVEDSITDLNQALDSLEGGRVAVEAVARADNSREASEQLAVALFLLIEAQAERPLTPKDAETVREITKHLRDVGAGSLRLPTAIATPGALVAIPAAQDDFRAMFRWHLERVKTASVALIREFLTVPETRIRLSHVEAVGGRDAWEGKVRKVLGDGFLPVSVDTWAYRVYTIGLFEAADHSGAVGVTIYNNWPLGPDGRTSVICNNLHGRSLSIRAGREQIDAYRKAIRESDFTRAGIIWPMLRITKNDQTDRINSLVAQLGNGFGLPPYHGRCRTSVRPIYS